MPVSIFPTQRSRKRSQSFLRIFSWNVAGRNGTYDKKPVKGDPLDDGTDQSGRARSTATTNVRECNGYGLPASFLGSVSNNVGFTDALG